MKLFHELADVVVREEMQADPSVVEHVLDVEKKIIKKYSSKINPQIFSNIENLSHLYHPILDDVKKEFTLFEGAETILQSYISCRENRGLYGENAIRGMFAGSLLECISMQTDKHIEIDGQGRIWNYLFYNVANARNFTLKNIQGDEILRGAAYHEGVLQNIQIESCIGNGLLQNAANEKGRIENILLRNILGNNTLLYSGLQGGIMRNITLQKMQGGYILGAAGDTGGHIQRVYISEIEGPDNLLSAGINNAYVDGLIILQSRGDRLLKNFAAHEGNVKNILVHESESGGILSNLGNVRKAEHIVVSSTIGKEIITDTHYKGVCNAVLRDSNLQEYHKRIIAEIKTLVETMHEYTITQRPAVYEKIAALQESLFSEEKQ